MPASDLVAQPVLLLSPHLDDAAFSAGFLLDHAGVEVWTVFAGIPDEDVVTDWDRRNGYASGAHLMRDRRAEDAAALEAVPHQQLDYLERAYVSSAQRTKDLADLVERIKEWLAEHPGGVVAVPAGSGVHMEPAWYDAARGRLRALTHRPAPEGLSTPTPSDTTTSHQAGERHHPRERLTSFVRGVLHADFQRRRHRAQRLGMLANEDHVALRDAIIANREALACGVIFYEEFPYAWSRTADGSLQQLQRSLGFPVEYVEVDVDAARKFARISRYVTQVQLMDPEHRRFESESKIPVNERYWISAAHSGAGDPHSVELSVVIPTFNGSQRLPLQLEALTRQASAPAFEVIVVDNGSTDGVAHVAAGWHDRLNLRVVLAPARQGIAYARNVGARIAQAPILAFCDDDDVVGEQWVAAAAEAMSDAEFVTGTGVEFPAETFTSVDAARHALREATLAGTDPHTQAPYPAPVLGDYPILLGGNCAMRREVFAEMQGFDLRFDPGAEEKDFVLRYMKLGKQLYLAPAMRLAVRRRSSARGQLKRTFSHGKMYVALAHAHGLEATSPVLNQPPFKHDLPRAAAALLRSALLRRPETADAADRLALRCGQLTGWADIHLLKRTALTECGTGWLDPAARKPHP